MLIATLGAGEDGGNQGTRVGSGRVRGVCEIVKGGPHVITGGCCGSPGIGLGTGAGGAVFTAVQEGGALVVVSKRCHHDVCCVDSDGGVGRGVGHVPALGCALG